MGLSVLCVVLAGLGCQKESDTSGTARVFEQLSARETAYHASVNRLPDPTAVRTETADYAGDMHDMLGSMQDACREMMHGTSGMGGHTMDDMTAVMDRMQSNIVDHASHMQGMDDLDAMRAACDEHHDAMTGMLQDMGDVLDNVMPCCGGR